MNQLSQTASLIASEISSVENRHRKRTASAQKHFENAIECLVTDLWLGTVIHPEYEVGIHRQSNWYSETPQYRDSNLTYKQAIAAYDGMVSTDFIQVVKEGFLDRDTGRSDVTRVIATEKLLKVLEGLEGNPFKEVKPDLDKECILLRDRINGQRELVPYKPDKTTNEMRENLTTINKCFARHWPDLRIVNNDYMALQERLRLEQDQSPIDFSKRILTRIFSNGRFDHGGRFCRAWWHNVPIEYRKYITIDGKRTCEYDYSLLNPHMVYFLRGAKMGDEDAYDRVFDGEHRDIVKEAFNTMIQASTNLTRKPKKLDLSDVDFDWTTLKQAILDAHKPIADVFFKGHGNHLQFIDSCIVETVMLNFIRAEDAPVLPVHDSFIMHYAYGELGELEEEMRRSFHGFFKKDINVKSEIGVMLPSSFDRKEWNDVTFEDQIHRPPEYSQWEDRNF
ncbi:hypothetical protein OBB02_01175 [Candidatus Puniceispirillum sp.]|nr:hypothetical protein [Candidatus Puniceispirillum sp.]